MSQFFKIQVSLVFCLTLCLNSARSQNLLFNLNSGDFHLCPLSLRSFDAGYMPPHTSLLDPNYELHDIRPLMRICNPADSVLNGAEAPVLLITDEWPCRYDARTIEAGTLVLMTVDSFEITSASIPSFDRNSERFGPAYVIATSEQCITELYPQISNIESVEFIPDGNPVYWNRANNPSYFVSETINLTLPCLVDAPYLIAATVLPEKNLEISFPNNSGTEFDFGFMTFGRGLVDRRSKRYDPTLIGNELVYNVASGAIGDLIQINPRCTGVDSFQVSIEIKPVDPNESCLLQTNYPFSVAASQDTMISAQAGDQYRLTIPLGITPISFISDGDELKQLPNRDPQGRHKSYYVYDDFLFDLVIGSQGACDQLNVDLNGGPVSSTSSFPNYSAKIFDECRMVAQLEHYSCTTHKTSDVIMLSNT